MLNSCGMDCANYSTTLIGWVSTAPNNLQLSATGRNYGTNAASARNYLVNNKGWTITGDVASNTICYPTSNDLATQATLNLYPNPSLGGAFTLESLGAAATGTLSVRDALGKELYSEQVEGFVGKKYLSLNLDKGIYFVTVDDAARSVNTLKLVVQ